MRLNLEKYASKEEIEKEFELFRNCSFGKGSICYECEKDIENYQKKEHFYVMNVLICMEH